MKTKNENMKKEMLEESGMTPLDELAMENEMRTEEREAIEAIRKYTNEDDENELGEISVKSILGGDFLMSKFMIKQIMFVVFCVFLMLIYTGNRYDSQQDIILIDSLRGRLQEVKYNVLTQSSELMNLTRQSNVEKRLRDTPDSLLRNSITPPFLIKANEKQIEAEEEKIEEVLVDSSELKAKEPEEDENEGQGARSEGQGARSEGQGVRNEGEEARSEEPTAEKEKQQPAESDNHQPTKTTEQP